MENFYGVLIIDARVEFFFFIRTIILCLFYDLVLLRIFGDIKIGTREKFLWMEFNYRFKSSLLEFFICIDCSLSGCFYNLVLQDFRGYLNWN